jgi:hypothetical protein
MSAISPAILVAKLLIDFGNVITALPGACAIVQDWLLLMGIFGASFSEAS